MDFDYASVLRAASITEENSIFLTYAVLIILALIPIIIGSYSALHSIEEPEETLSASDAYWFPLYGSGVLFGFYLVFKFIAKEYINYVVSAYFFLFGSLAIFSLFDGAARYLFPKKLLPTDPYVFSITKSSKGKRTKPDYVMMMIIIIIII